MSAKYPDLICPSYMIALERVKAWADALTTEQLAALGLRRIEKPAARETVTEADLLECVRCGQTYRRGESLRCDDICAPGASVHFVCGGDLVASPRCEDCTFCGEPMPGGHVWDGEDMVCREASPEAKGKDDGE